MTSNALAKQLFSSYEQYKLDHLNPKNCKHEKIFSEMFDIVVKSNKLMSMEEIGSSIEGRSINLVTVGKGNKKVLLWSQMHGDESTATLALMDIFNLLIRRGSADRWITEMLREVTIHFIPMLNPDGAERGERRTSVGIDMNRDALDLATPEARILRDIQRQVKPAFGFNLHDQELSSVGNSRSVTAIALLAPAADEKKTKPQVRVRAMRVASVIARSLGQFADGHLASYDDTFEPRAFGDNMQRWGTSTVLIESGQWPNDKEKTFIRKLNYIGILTAIQSIAQGSFQDVSLDYYTDLAMNAKRIYDIIIRGITLRHPGGWSHSADVGLLFPAELNKDRERSIVTIKDVGDLRTHGALETIDGASRTVHTHQVLIDRSLPLTEFLNILQLPHR